MCVVQTAATASLNKGKGGHETDADEPQLEHLIVGVLLLTPLLLLLPTTAVFTAFAALLHVAATAVQVCSALQSTWCTS